MLGTNAGHWLQWLAGSIPVVDSTSSRPSPASWERYVRAPTSQIVYPVSVISNYTTGNVTNPNGLLCAGCGVTTLTRTIPLEPPLWPRGTTANASVYHAENAIARQARAYFPDGCSDGDSSIFWAADTPSVYSNTLTILSLEMMDLPGITILSSEKGVFTNLVVEVLGTDGSWTIATAVTKNNATRIQVPFVPTIQTYGVRMNITQDQISNSGEYVSIIEVWPGIVDDPPPPPSVVVDFGMPVVGFLAISFAGASSNRPGIRLAFSEMTEYLTDVSDFTRSYNGDTITPGSDQIAVLPDPYIWNDTHGCVSNSKVCSDGLHGFRYVKIYLDALKDDFPEAQPYGFVAIDAVSLNFSAYLGTPNTFTGWFECSDTTLNQFWYDAAYTNEMCIDTFRVNDTEPRNAASPSLIGKLVIHDAPKRDRDPYVGDVAVAGRTLYLTHNVSIAARNVLADLADHQRSDGWIPPASIGNYGLALFDYPLWWVVASCDLLLYTEDGPYWKNYYPTMLKVMDEYYPSATDNMTGLVSKGLGGSGGYGDYAFLPRTGIVTYYNALYVLALTNAANIAHFYNYSGDAKRWKERAKLVTAAINEHLWDPVVGAYVDSINSTTHGQDGNMLAVLAGIAPRSRTISLLSKWSSLALPYGNPFFSNDDLAVGFSTRIYPFISYFEIAARFETSGMEDSAIEEIKRLYGWMASEDPGTTFWEGIGAQGRKYEGGYTSAAHGWSTGVLPALSNYVLGVVPTAPGFRHWILKPIPAGGVEWARGEIPTPKGPFKVDWALQDVSKSFQMDIEVPRGTEGVVFVPVPLKRGEITVNDAVVWKRGRGLLLNARHGDGYVQFGLKGGNYRITMTQRVSFWDKLRHNWLSLPFH